MTGPFSSSKGFRESLRCRRRSAQVTRPSEPPRITERGVCEALAKAERLDALTAERKRRANLRANLRAIAGAVVALVVFAGKREPG